MNYFLFSSPSREGGVVDWFLLAPPLACWNEVEIPLSGPKRSGLVRRKCGGDPDIGAQWNLFCSYSIGVKCLPREIHDSDSLPS
jgi:hypothetical protein